MNSKAVQDYSLNIASPTADLFNKVLGRFLSEKFCSSMAKDYARLFHPKHCLSTSTKFCEMQIAGATLWTSFASCCLFDEEFSQRNEAWSRFGKAILCMTLRARVLIRSLVVRSSSSTGWLRFAFFHFLHKISVSQLILKFINYPLALHGSIWKHFELCWVVHSSTKLTKILMKAHRKKMLPNG